jgi:hypothetical protein
MTLRDDPAFLPPPSWWSVVLYAVLAGAALALFELRAYGQTPVGGVAAWSVGDIAAQLGPFITIAGALGLFHRFLVKPLTDRLDALEAADKRHADHLGLATEVGQPLSLIVKKDSARIRTLEARADATDAGMAAVAEIVEDLGEVYDKLRKTP